jgi:hypothetical protein
MIDFTESQLKALTVWANERLMNILDGGKYDGDDWYIVDSSIPELENKIDINIYDYEDEDGKIFIRCTAYEIEQLPNGLGQTKCDVWVNIF